MNPHTRTLLVALLCTTPTAAQELCFVDIAGGESGPTVLVLARPSPHGRAGTLAARQIAHWPIGRGRLVVAWPAGNDARSQAALRTSGQAELLASVEPDLLVELDEDYDFHGRAPGARGSTVARGGGAAALAATRELAEAMRAVTPTGPAWQVVPREQTGDGPPALRVTTSAKDPRHGQRLWLRVRQHRAAVHAALAGLRMRPPGGDALGHDLLAQRAAGGPLRIGVYDGPGAVSTSGHGPPWILASLERDPTLDVHVVGPDEIRAGVLAQLDVVVFGGGGGRAQANGLRESGREAVRTFVHAGGGYVGMCAGAFLAGCDEDRYLAIAPVETHGESGSTVVGLRCAPLAKDLLGLEGNVSAKYSNGPRIELRQRPDVGTGVIVAEFAAVAGGPRRLLGTPAIVAGEAGQGRYVLFSTHCERAPTPHEAFRRALEWAKSRGD